MSNFYLKITAPSLDDSDEEDEYDASLLASVTASATSKFVPFLNGSEKEDDIRNLEEISSVPLPVGQKVENLPKAHNCSSGTEVRVKLPPNWRTARDSEGRLYYYNRKTKETSWEPPEMLEKWVLDFLYLDRNSNIF